MASPHGRTEAGARRGQGAAHTRPGGCALRLCPRLLRGRLVHGEHSYVSTQRRPRGAGVSMGQAGAAKFKQCHEVSRAAPGHKERDRGVTVTQDA